VKLSTFQAWFRRMVHWANASISVLEKTKLALEALGLDFAELVEGLLKLAGEALAVEA
jgi:hypothetical protein